MMSITETLRKRQRDNLIEGLMCLHRSTVYSMIDSGLALPGEVDRIIKDLETIVRETYE